MKNISIAAFMSFAYLSQAGNNNVVIGNGNTISGNSNKAVGNNDKIYGSYNTQYGDNSYIQGNNNYHEGDNRKIIGNGQYFVSQAPNNGFQGSYGYNSYKNIKQTRFPDEQKSSERSYSRLTRQSGSRKERYEENSDHTSHINLASRNDDIVNEKRKQIMDLIQNKIKNGVDWSNWQSSQQNSNGQQNGWVNQQDKGQKNNNGQIKLNNYQNAQSNGLNQHNVGYAYGQQVGVQTGQQQQENSKTRTQSTKPVHNWY